MYIAYFTKSRFYGLAKPGWTDEQLQDQLGRFGIDFFFYHELPGSGIPAFLRGYQDIAEGVIPGVRVFAVSGNRRGDGAAW